MWRGIHWDNMISPYPHTLNHTLGCQDPGIPFPNSQSFQSANLYESWVCPPECKLGTPVGQGVAQRWGETTRGSVHGTWDRWSRVFYMSLTGHSHHTVKPGCREKEVDLGPRQWEASSPWPPWSRCNCKESGNSKCEPDLYIANKIMFVMEGRTYVFKNFSSLKYNF